MNNIYRIDSAIECHSPSCRLKAFQDKRVGKDRTRWKFHFINSQGKNVLEISLCVVCQEKEFMKASQNLHERIKELEDTVHEILSNMPRMETP